MKMTSIAEQMIELEFVSRAAKHFEENPKHFTFGETKPGELWGVRWGMGENCVLVIKLDEEKPLAIYQNEIRKIHQPPAPIDRLIELLERFADEDDTPEKNCSCHISPPCGDCVDYSHLRELYADARKAIKQHREIA